MKDLAKKPSTRRRRYGPFIGWALLVVGFAAAPTGVQRFKEYLEADAFASLKRDEMQDQIGMRLIGVHFRQYHGTTLVNVGNANRIDAMRDRNHLRMYGVTNGQYRDKDRVFNYEANIADWSEWNQALSIEGGVHVQDKKIDLKTWSVQFESNKHRLIAKGDVKGRVEKGTLVAQNLTYQTETGAYKGGPVSWTGEIDATDFQDPSPATPEKRRSWHFKSEGVDHPNLPTDETTYTNAVATDGDIFVVAPKIIYRRKDDSILATGRVQYFSGKANLVADKAEVFRKEKRALFTGNVEMVSKAKKDQKEKGVIEPIPPFQPLRPDQVSATKPPDPSLPESEVKKDKQLRESKNIREFPLVMVAAKIEYWYAKGSRRAVITGDPQGRQEFPEGRWRHVWSNIAYYDGEKETLRLVSGKNLRDTRMKNSIGDHFTADWLTLSTKEDDDTFTGSGFDGDAESLEKDDDDILGKKGSTPLPPNPPKKTPPPRFNRV